MGLDPKTEKQYWSYLYTNGVRPGAANVDRAFRDVLPVVMTALNTATGGHVEYAEYRKYKNSTYRYLESDIEKVLFYIERRE